MLFPITLTDKQAFLLDAAASDGLLPFAAESLPDGSIEQNQLRGGVYGFTRDQALALGAARTVLDDTAALVAALVEIGEVWTFRRAASVAGALEAKLAANASAAAESPVEPRSDDTAPPEPLEPPVAVAAAESTEDADPEPTPPPPVAHEGGVRPEPSQSWEGETVFVPWCGCGWEGARLRFMPRAATALSTHLDETMTATG